VLGLGNPGAEFERSRHNCGAEAVALLARRHGATLKRDVKARALTAEADIAGTRAVLAVPQTYYNDSGQAATALLRRHDLGPAGLVVIHDELDLVPGSLKVKWSGGLAGNNGLRSIKAHLKSQDFTRIRIGVGKPPGRQDGVDHVLRRPGKAERAELDIAIEHAADAVELIVAEGIEAAMQRYNQRAPQ